MSTFCSTASVSPGSGDDTTDSGFCHTWDRATVDIPPDTLADINCNGLKSCSTLPDGKSRGVVELATCEGMLQIQTKDMYGSEHNKPAIVRDDLFPPMLRGLWNYVVARGCRKRDVLRCVWGTDHSKGMDRLIAIPSPHCHIPVMRDLMSDLDHRLAAKGLPLPTCTILWYRIPFVHGRCFSCAWGNLSAKGCKYTKYRLGGGALCEPVIAARHGNASRWEVKLVALLVDVQGREWSYYPLLKDWFLVDPLEQEHARWFSLIEGKTRKQLQT